MANATVSGVEFRDIASGKTADNVTGPVDLLTIGPNAGSQNKRPARAFVADGAVEVEVLGESGTPGVRKSIALPDRGSYTYDLQIIGVVSGTVTVLW